MTERLWSRLRWVRTTPRGCAVEPEVYCRNATESSPTPGSVQAAASGPEPSSVASQGREASSGASAANASAAPTNADVVSTSRGRASPATARSRATSGAQRAGLGGYTGTATAPAYREPKKAATYSGPG